MKIRDKVIFGAKITAMIATSVGVGYVVKQLVKHNLPELTTTFGKVACEVGKWGLAGVASGIAADRMSKNFELLEKLSSMLGTFESLINEEEIDKGFIEVFENNDDATVHY